MSWLTKFLGIDDLITEIGARHIDQINDYHDILQSYRERENWLTCEVKRLTDLMLTEHGVIQREGEVKVTESKPQIVNRRGSFKALRDKYERADAAMAEKISQEHTEVLTEYWTKKNQQAMQEKA